MNKTLRLRQKWGLWGIALLIALAPTFAHSQSAALTRLHREGASLFKAGNFKAAIPITEQALVLSERAFGPNASRTGFVLKNLAGLREKIGDFRAAEPLYRRAAAILSATLGADHAIVRETDAQATRASELARKQAVTLERIKLTPPPAFKPKPVESRNKQKPLGWSVQLGAFTQLKNSNREAKKLRVSLADVLGGAPLEIRETLDGKQHLYRVRTLSLRDRKAAQRLCARIKLKRQTCFITR